MTKNQLKILGTIPQVISALNALAAEAEEMRSLMGGLGPGAVYSSESINMNALGPIQYMPRATTSPSPRPQPKVDTSNPDRFHAVQQDPERAAKDREYLEAMKRTPERISRLKQFEHDATQEEETG